MVIALPYSCFSAGYPKFVTASRRARGTRANVRGWVRVADAVDGGTPKIVIPETGAKRRLSGTIGPNIVERGPVLVLVHFNTLLATHRPAALLNGSRLAFASLSWPG
jgi:hypothetical protein